MGIEGSCDGDGPKPNRIRVCLGTFPALRTVLLRQPCRAHGKALKQQFSKAVPGPAAPGTCELIRKAHLRHPPKACLLHQNSGGAQKPRFKKKGGGRGWKQGKEVGWAGGKGRKLYLNNN